MACNDIQYTTMEHIWINTLFEVEKFVLNNNRLPSANIDKNDVSIKKLGYWVSTQKANYKKNGYSQHMRNENIRKLWKKFMCKYPNIFNNNEYVWKYTLKQIEVFILKHNRLPSKIIDNYTNYCNTNYCNTIYNNLNYNLNYNYQLSIWIHYQKKHYKKNCSIIKINSINKLWEKFIIKYNHLFN